MNEKYLESIKDRIVSLEIESTKKNERIDQLEQRLKAASKLLSSQIRFTREEGEKIFQQISMIEQKKSEGLNEKTSSSDVIAILKLYHEGKLPFGPHAKL